MLEKTCSPAETHPELTCSCKHTFNATCEVWVTQSGRSQRTNVSSSCSCTFSLLSCFSTSPAYSFHFSPLHHFIYFLYHCVCQCVLFFSFTLSLLWLPLYHQLQKGVCECGFWVSVAQVNGWPVCVRVGVGVYVCVRVFILVGITAKAASVRNRRCTRSVRTLPEKQLGMSSEEADHAHTRPHQGRDMNWTHIFMHVESDPAGSSFIKKSCYP